MKKKNKNLKTFFVFLRAGLWGNTGAVSGFKFQVSSDEDWSAVYQLAQEQSVQGLVLQGIESFRIQDSGFKIPQMLLLQWIGEVQVIGLRNKAMNAFISELIEKLRKHGIFALLVKGQGVAQCYERPLWRASGDIDLLLDDNNYEKAKALLIPLAEEVQDEEIWKKHQAIIIKGFDVELLGKMPFALSRKADKAIDSVIDESFKLGGARVWSYNNSDIFLPSPDNDVILVFTHFLHHFFIEGVGLRQICDWCRLLYTYKDSLNYGLLESRIRKMGLMSEWKAFYALATKYLGMPEVPCFMFQDSGDSQWERKADKIMELVLECGNFGHNKDLSYRTRYSGLTYKIVAAWRRLKDFASLVPVFPLDAPKFFFTYLFNKAKS